MKSKRTSLFAGALAVAIAAALIAVAVGGTASASRSTVGKGHALGKTVLVNRAGRTLYTLSAETKGRFICTGSCLSLWRPLVVSHGQKPTGSASLGTVRRPDGRTQVTYKGKPLYTFVQDTKRGQAKGEGFMDVGVWHAAMVGSSTNTNTQTTTTMSPSYGGYGGYGGY